MGKITDQFLEAIQEWAKRTGHPESLIPIHMFMMAGGRWPATRSPSQSEDLAKDLHNLLKGIRNQFTLEETRTFLELTLRQTGFTETFIVIAFIRAIEDRFRVDLALYEKEQHRRERWPQLVREIAADPERFKEFQRQTNESSEKLQEQGCPIPQKKIHSPEDLLEFASHLEKITQRDPVIHVLGDIQAHEDLRVWREVTAPILEPENLKESDWQDFRSISGQFFDSGDS